MKRYIRKVHHAYLKGKIFFYRRYLSRNHVYGEFKIVCPTLFMGPGKIDIKKSVQLGYNPSPFLYSRYNYLEARAPVSEIVIDDNTVINNNATIISEGAGIYIGKDCLIGPCVEIYDTDFHPLDPILRRTHAAPSVKVVIGDNVFIGSGVKILKGVTIGRNCVIGAGSVVAKSFPDNVIIAGNPARKIKDL